MFVTCQTKTNTFSKKLFNKAKNNHSGKVNNKSELPLIFVKAKSGSSYNAF
jgi:hypothetical protein